MCIICSNEKIGDSYLKGYKQCLRGFKGMEESLLALSDPENIDEYFDAAHRKLKARQYDKAHKRLVRIRKRLNEVEEMREDY